MDLIQALWGWPWCNNNGWIDYGSHSTAVTASLEETEELPTSTTTGACSDVVTEQSTSLVQADLQYKRFLYKVRERSVGQD